MRPRLLLALIVCGLLAGLWLRLAPRGGGQEVGVRPDLSGRWVTDSETHSDRYIDISDQFIVFGQGSGAETRHQIVGVWLFPSETETHYRIRYFTDELDQLDIAVTISGSPPVLRVKNQGGIAWTRER